MPPEPWAPGQKERYQHALEVAWDDLDNTFRLTVRRVGLQSMAAQHAQTYMRRARVLKDMVEGLLAKPTVTETAPPAIRKAVAELVEFKNTISRL